MSAYGKYRLDKTAFKIQSFEFLFDAEELNSASLQFEVYSRKTKKSVVYALNSSVYQLENVMIKKIK